MSDRAAQEIATLEPLNRTLLLLYLDERSTRDMAEVLGMSASNVTTRISRLKQRIRDHVDGIRRSQRILEEVASFERD